MEENSNRGDDFELDLEMNDLLDDFVGHNTSFVSDIHQDMDIFAENHSGNNCNCCGNSAGGKKKNACHDYAMDSTFISFECEQKQQLLQETSVMAPHFLEHTFDNMSQHESSNHGLLSDLLRDKEMGGSRSRFISDETMFGNLNDIPDKSFDKEEEESKEQSLPTISSLIAPVELLGIPLDNEVDEDVTNIKLSPYIQKDNSLPMLWPSNPFSDSDCRLNFDQTENMKLEKFADEITCEEQVLPKLKNRSEISEDIYINDGSLRGPFCDAGKTNEMNLSMGLFADMRLAQYGAGNRMPFVDHTAPNTPTGNDFSFMSPSLTPKKPINTSILPQDNMMHSDDLKIVSKFSATITSMTDS